MARKSALKSKPLITDFGERPDDMNEAQTRAYESLCEKSALHDAAWARFDSAGDRLDNAKSDAKRETCRAEFREAEAKVVRSYNSMMSAYNGFAYAMTHTMLVPRSEVENIVGAALKDHLHLMGLDGRSLGPLISDLTLALQNSGVVIEEYDFDEIPMCDDCMDDDDGA